MHTPATRNQVLMQQQRKDELRRQLDILANKTDKLKISTNLQAKKVAEQMITTDSHILRQHLQNHNTNPKAASVQACAHAYFSEPDTRFFLKNPKKEALRASLHSAIVNWINLHPSQFLPEFVEQAQQLQTQKEKILSELNSDNLFATKPENTSC